MPSLGDLYTRSVKVPVLKRLLGKSRLSNYEQQKRELQKMLKTAKHTQFGQKYKFEVILNSYHYSHTPSYYYDIFKENVPVHSYNKIFSEWWHRALQGEEDVAWPGKVNIYALSSGTSESASKHIPITNDMLKAIKKTGVRQLLSLRNYELPTDIFTRGVLMLGGSTSLQVKEGSYHGDLSGIMTSRLPRWFNIFYKPGKKIAKTKDWSQKLDLITKKAKSWDIGYVAGVPSWMQLLFEKIIAYYKVKTIHDIWPNLTVFAYGGVAFEPYKTGFEKLLGKPLIYIETYLASEGFLALQMEPEKPLRLILNNGIFFEFVPFNSDNFNDEGELLPNCETLLINNVKEGIDYAILITTVAGTWRYLIGDTIRFINKKNAEIAITGRTKHFISLCGEHLSVDNMNKAIQMVSEDLNITVKEFAVAGIPFDTMFAHKWYIGVDTQVDEELLKIKLDNYLMELNDDYRTERLSALKDVFINVLPSDLFYKWMKSKGKEGGANKFPRVLKKDTLKDWEHFIKKESYKTLPEISLSN
ncbi:MAG: GH3 auxin-responsive promoter family protein [Bacteroidota bacterium]|nr:GH3 auxin-responsive promoter family protein [Bacteroidota bacterium]